MREFMFGTTTLTIGTNCMTVTCPTRTCCRPQGASATIVSKLPEDLAKLRQQLEALAAAGFQHVGYQVEDEAQLRTAEHLLNELNR